MRWLKSFHHVQHLVFGIFRRCPPEDEEDKRERENIAGSPRLIPGYVQATTARVCGLHTCVQKNPIIQSNPQKKLFPRF